jgi:hypothetical protein
MIGAYCPGFPRPLVSASFITFLVTEADMNHLPDALPTVKKPARNRANTGGWMLLGLALLLIAIGLLQRFA